MTKALAEMRPLILEDNLFQDIEDQLKEAGSQNGELVRKVLEESTSTGGG